MVYQPCCSVVYNRVICNVCVYWYSGPVVSLVLLLCCSSYRHMPCFLYNGIPALLSLLCCRCHVVMLDSVHICSPCSLSKWILCIHLYAIIFLVIPKWTQALQAYPLKSLATFFLTGITSGFRVGYNRPRRPLKSAHKNLAGALLHPDVVEDYLAAEVLSHRVAGPYARNSCPDAHISRFGVIPKRHQQRKWRLNIDLSYPKLHSVNDGIPKHLCSLTYVTVDDAITNILESGQGTLLAKVDIKHAFRLLPVHPADRHLLTMEWNQSIYIDTCLPLGLGQPLSFSIF